MHFEMETLQKKKHTWRAPIWIKDMSQSLKRSSTILQTLCPFTLFMKPHCNDIEIVDCFGVFSFHMRLFSFWREKVEI